MAGNLQSYPNALMERNDSELICAGEFRIRQSWDALPLKAYFVARSLARFVRLYRLWSREAIRRIFRYCFHLVNSSPAKAMSPGATLVLFSIAPTVTSLRRLFSLGRASSSDAANLSDPSCAAGCRRGCRRGVCANLPSSRTFRAGGDATSRVSRRAPPE